MSQSAGSHDDDVTMDLSTTAQLVTALGIGGFLGQYLATSHERRAARADVLRALLGTERARWYDTEGSAVTWERWLVACRDLRAAALVAGLPARAVDTYIGIADTARRESEVRWERNPDEEFSPSISSESDALVQEAARLVSDLAWSPRRTRLTLKRRVKALEARTREHAWEQH